MSADLKFCNIDKRNNVLNDMSEAIGQTPMVRLSKKINDTHADVLVKLESNQPMASVKDRLALGLIIMAEADGRIKPGETVLVEATSGNTGIALAQLAAVRGYKLILTMPEQMSLERRTLLKIFGAELILTPKEKGIPGAIKKAKDIVANTPNAVLTEQFASEYNSRIHRVTTGPEIEQQTKGAVDYIVAGVGTGGTITGVAQYFNEDLKKPNVKCIAVEPAESPVLSGGKPGPHKIQGLGAGFKPPVMGDLSLISEVLQCSSETAIKFATLLPGTEGIFCGFSGGANVYAALEVARRPENKGKTIVTFIPSFGERYLSTVLFNEVKEEAAKLPVVPLSEYE